jgi:hypothetical protein
MDIIFPTLAEYPALQADGGLIVPPPRRADGRKEAPV